MKTLKKYEDQRKAVTLIEILIAVTIIGVGIIPVMRLVISSRSDARILQFHMMAGELAASTLDNILALEYEEAFNFAKTLEQRGEIDALVEMNSVLEELAGFEGLEGMSEDFARSFRSLTYRVEVLPPEFMETQFLATVHVSFETPAGGAREHRFEAIKFNKVAR